jgi:GTP diphosphokinase
VEDKVQEIDKKILSIISQEPEEILTHMEEFRELMFQYKAAIRKVRTKLEILNDEISVKDQRNPIEFVKSRLKKPSSIAQKLRRRGLELSVKSIKENLTDIAGIRVVCSFIDDIYNIAEILANQEDVKVIEVKDYIKNVKPNGYSSLHMIIEVPIYLSDNKEYVKIELQIRTIAMDFWASLEHQMKYKKTIKEAPQIIKQLKECADKIQEVDNHMMMIRKSIEKVTIDVDNSNY